MTQNKVSPADSGCWFCNTDNETNDWVFSFEFDTYFHKSCLIVAMKDKGNLEAQIIAKEFKLLR
jgi:hypothetical protein